MKDKITILKGELFADYRGEIASINQFTFEGVRRTYILHHSDTAVVRGWHSHQHERKWFLDKTFAEAMAEKDSFKYESDYFD